MGLVDGLLTGVVARRVRYEASVKDVRNPPREGLFGPKLILFELRINVFAAGR